jgi:hypothetical protein
MQPHLKGEVRGSKGKRVPFDERNLPVLVPTDAINNTSIS